jgi:PD-(D/E)XK nuclease superfamily
MRWSYSASRSFKQCQRQWFFKNIVASARSKDTFRRRVYLLSKLQSISAWRGKIVDHVISETIIPSVNRKIRITLKDAKTRARWLFDNQLAFAKRHPISDPNLRVSKEGDRFALFHVMEYAGEIPEQELQVAWQEIETALSNLFVLGDMKELLKSSSYIVAQRALQFTLMDDVTALAYPDLVAFRNGSAPVIVDWKVHTFGQSDAWLQLAIYAIALSRCTPHSDFPSGFKVEPTKAKLHEAQLLTNAVREHVLDEDHITEAEEYIIASAYEMSCLTDGKDYADLEIDDFRPALHAESCQRCAFRAICWEGQHVH